MSIDIVFKIWWDDTVDNVYIIKYINVSNNKVKYIIIIYWFILIHPVYLYSVTILTTYNNNRLLYILYIMLYYTILYIVHTAFSRWFSVVINKWILSTYCYIFINVKRWNNKTISYDYTNLFTAKQINKREIIIIIESICIVIIQLGIIMSCQSV